MNRLLKLTTTCLFILHTVIFTNAQQQSISIIPQPNLVQKNEGSFVISKSTVIFFSAGGESAAQFFAGLLNKPKGFTLSLKQLTDNTEKNAIYFVIDPTLTDKTNGAYQLDVSPEKIVAKATDDLGLFYAAQSLRQLLPSDIENKNFSRNISWQIPAVKLTDAPRYAWRGYMKDVSRTFYGIDVIKKYLDVMALYKMNVFHFHLTDDQGWRIEIKKHPELTSTKATTFGQSSNQPKYRSGYFTQAQIKEIVKYAAERRITVVPEIDVPGHCWPMVITNPQLGTNKNLTPDYVVSFMDSYNYWGFQYTPNPLDPTNEEVYSFLTDVFTEVAELFPGKYIHFGGDEVRKSFWQEAPHIQDFMKKKGMTSVADLQSYFVDRVSKIITGKGKIPIGWNDILEHQAENLPKNTTIMSWIGGGAVKEAAKHGFPVIATPSFPLYFDISQDNINDGTMVDWNYGGGDGKNGRGNTLANVYRYDPSNGLTVDESKLILGIQANMWPAVAQEIKDINVQNFPRLLAVAEIAWTSPAKKDFANFLLRLENHYKRLDLLGIDYFKKGGYIINTWQPSIISNDFRVKKWDVTSKVYADGLIQAGFLYTGGSSYLKIKNVKLLENGRVIASDLHESLADDFRGTPFKKNMFFYTFQLKKYDPKATYHLEAEIAGKDSNDSYGNITFNLSPTRAFSQVESSKN